MDRVHGFGLAALLLVTAGAGAYASAHPLDPLSAAEIRAVVAVLQGAGYVDPDTRYALIDLDEPVKRDVLAWERGQAFVREAFVIARRDRTVYEAVVDIGAQRVERWQAIPNVESAILDEEIKLARRVTTAAASIILARCSVPRSRLGILLIRLKRDAVLSECPVSPGR
jgi:Cu2+-containing amine oxidase